MFALQHSFKEDLAAHTATLTIKGNDTIEHYQTMLRSVVYRNNNTTPVTTSRSLRMWVYEGVSYSNVVASHLRVTVGKSTPVLSVIQIATAAEKAARSAASPPAIPVVSLIGFKAVSTPTASSVQMTSATPAMMASAGSALPPASSSGAFKRTLPKSIGSLTPPSTSKPPEARTSVRGVGA
jgi:hypothetical protein